MHKMITGHNKELQRKWAFIVSKATGARSATSARQDEGTVLRVVDDSRSAAVQQLDSWYQQQSAANSLTAKLQVAHAIHAAAQGNALGRTVYLNDPTLPYALRFVPV